MGKSENTNIINYEKCDFGIALVLAQKWPAIQDNIVAFQHASQERFTVTEEISKKRIKFLSQLDINCRRKKYTDTGRTALTQE